MHVCTRCNRKSAFPHALAKLEELRVHAPWQIALCRTPIPLSYTRHTSRFMVREPLQRRAGQGRALAPSLHNFKSRRVSWLLWSPGGASDPRPPCRPPLQMIWLTLLPFTLWDSCHWAMLPIAGIVSFLLLGIEEIGVQVSGSCLLLHQ